MYTICADGTGSNAGTAAGAGAKISNNSPLKCEQRMQLCMAMAA